MRPENRQSDQGQVSGVPTQGEDKAMIPAFFVGLIIGFIVGAVAALLVVGADDIGGPDGLL